MEERYEIKGKIGQGGLGAVYRAFDVRMNREVAIKRILASPDDSSVSEEATRQLVKEAGSLAALQHPNIVTIYDVGSDEDGPFVVMELLTGETLEEIIGKGSFTWQDFRQLAMQTLEALIAAQELHLVHRDLKPSNIMLSWLPSGKFQVKIVDFGLAKLSAKPSLQTIDQSDGVFGSIYFMAPEQFERVPIDLKADLYAIGCVFYYALTGTYPFDGDTAAGVMASHLQHHVTPLQEIRQGIPLWACDWIMWHINRQPTDRPESAREALRYFVENDAQGTTPLSTGIPAAAAEEAKRPRLVIPGAPVPALVKEPVPTQPIKTAAAPVALMPPKGSKPSVHTTAQVVQSAPPSQASTEEETETPSPPPLSPPPLVTPVPALAKADPTGAAPPVLRKAGSSTAPLLKAAGSPTQPIAPPTKPLQIAADRLPGSPPVPSTVALTPSSASASPSSAPLPTAPQVAPKSKPISPAIKVVIAVLLGLLAVGLGVIVLKKSGDNAEAKIYNEMIQAAAKDGATKVPVNKRGLEILLRNASTVSANTQREVVYKALYLAESTDGTDVDARIAEFATTQEIIPDVRIVLLRQVLRRRENPAIIGTLLDFARSTDDKMASIAAIEATRFMAKDAQFAEFLDIMKSTKDDLIRKAAEENAAEIIGKTDSKAALGKAVAEAHESATEDVVRYSMLRLLGRIGGESSLALARKNLNSEDVKDKIAAIVALGIWADDAGFKELIAFLGTGPDLATRSRAFESAYQYASEKEGDTKETWILLSTQAKTQDEQMKLIRGLANVKPEPWAFELLGKLEKESEYDRVIDLAERAIVRLKDIEKTQANPGGE
ncbi:protein kinase [Akkermansiaceae bacterium]|nr:protein kinase [Akkermansiaceae bacterium]